jgi:hypothetical protein
MQKTLLMVINASAARATRKTDIMFSSAAAIVFQSGRELGWLM